MRTHGREVLLTGFVKVFQDRRQCVDIRLVFGNFTIQHAQRIGRRPTLAIAAQLRGDIFKLLA